MFNLPFCHLDSTANIKELKKAHQSRLWAQSLFGAFTFHLITLRHSHTEPTRSASFHALSICEQFPNLHQNNGDEITIFFRLLSTSVARGRNGEGAERKIPSNSETSTFLCNPKSIKTNECSALSFRSAIFEIKICFASQSAKHKHQHTSRWSVVSCWFFRHRKERDVWNNNWILFLPSHANSFHVGGGF